MSIKLLRDRNNEYQAGGWFSNAGVLHGELTTAVAEINEIQERLAATRSALQGMLDWYEDSNGAGFCECDKSVDLTCRACVARAALA